MSDLADLLEYSDQRLEQEWLAVEQWLRSRFGRDTSIESILFLIGLHARGLGYSPKLEKEEKQDLIMEGSFLALETIGHFERVGMESDGRWVWERSAQLPELSVQEQEKLLKIGIIRYFEQFVETDLDS